MEREETKRGLENARLLTVIHLVSRDHITLMSPYFLLTSRFTICQPRNWKCQTSSLEVNAGSFLKGPREGRTPVLKTLKRPWACLSAIFSKLGKPSIQGQEDDLNSRAPNSFGQEPLCTLFFGEWAGFQPTRAALVGWKFTCASEERGWQSHRKCKPGRPAGV